MPDGNTATCEIGGEIAAGGECSCTFTGTVPPGDFPGSFTDVVTGCGTNATSPTEVCDDDDANVPYTDVPQPPTLTKTASSAQCQIDVTYDVVVTNGSTQDTLTLNTLNDDVYGNITPVHGNVISTTCGQAPRPRCAADCDRGEWQLHLFVCGKDQQLQHDGCERGDGNRDG